MVIRPLAPQGHCLTDLLRKAEPAAQTARAGRHLRAHQILPLHFPDEKIRNREKSDFAKASL